MTWRRWLSFAVFFLTAPLAVRPAAAQLAPTGGHYASQPSDTGFAGGVSSSGGYRMSDSARLEDLLEHLEGITEAQGSAI